MCVQSPGCVCGVGWGGVGCVRVVLCPRWCSGFGARFCPPAVCAVPGVGSAHVGVACGRLFCVPVRGPCETCFPRCALAQVKWSVIAAQLTGRVGKQCRERWFNHLDPAIRKGDWSMEEDRLIWEKQQEIGNKW
jgi:hypothetical protein